MDHNASTEFRELNDTLIEADTAFEVYQDAREAYKDARRGKYEHVVLENGDEVMIPLSKIMDDLMQLEVDSERFQTKLNGRTTKDERKAEIVQYMESIPEWVDLKNRLQMAEFNENIHKLSYEDAKENYSRLHTKVMAFRGEIEFLTENQKTLAEWHRNETEQLHKNLKEQELAIQHARKDAEELALERVRKECQLEEMRQGKAIKDAKLAAKAELNKYVEAVQPMLEFARQLQALQTVEVVEVV